MDSKENSSEQSAAEAKKELIYTKIYQKLKSIGSGASGEAFLIEGKKTKKQVVLKEIDLNEIPEEEIQEVHGEASIMKLLKHPNIIGIIDVFKTKSNKLSIIMEFAEQGDLNGILEARNLRYQQGDESALYSEEQIMNIFAQMCLALDVMHSQNIIHRDIKSHNILMMNNGQIKMADFGLACVFDATNNLAQTLIGTPYYFAPEVIRGGPWTYKVDVWGIGVVLYRLCTLQYPFDAKCNVHLVEQIATKEHKPIPDCYSKFLSHLIDSILKKDPNERISIHQILKLQEVDKAVERVVQAGLSQRADYHHKDIQESKQDLQEFDEISPDEIGDVGLKLSKQSSSRISEDQIHKLDLQILTNSQYKLKIKELYGDEKVLKGFELIESNKAILFEENAKQMINQILVDNDVDFTDKQEEFIKQASFRIIVDNLRQRGMSLHRDES